jgi:hypothetical protein
MSEAVSAVAETTATETAAPETSVIQGDTPDQRAQSLKAELIAAERAERAAELGDDATGEPPAQPDTQDAGDADPKVAARRQRLQALLDRETEATKARKARDQSRQPQGVVLQETEVQQLRARLERAEQIEQRFESLRKSPAQLLAMAEELEIAPEDFAAAIREGIENPERAIEAKARGAVDPVVKELRELKAELERERAEIRRSQETAAEQRAHAEAAHQFAQFTQQNAADAPHVARLMQADSNAFVSFANEIANTLPPGSGYQAVLDKMEENLHGFAALLGTTGQHVSGSDKATNRKTTASAGGITNRQATERASVPADEDSFKAKLATLDAVDDRARFLKDFYRRHET